MPIGITLATALFADASGRDLDGNSAGASAVNQTG